MPRPLLPTHYTAYIRLDYNFLYLLACHCIPSTEFVWIGPGARRHGVSYSLNGARRGKRGSAKGRQHQGREHLQSNVANSSTGESGGHEQQGERLTMKYVSHPGRSLSSFSSSS